MDNIHEDSKPNETVQDDVPSMQKVTESYLLLKQKIYETHEVIKQYNDKIKECDRLRTDLDTATKQIKKVTCNYNSTLAKVIKLELQNTEYKKNIETLTTQVNECQVKTAADQQHIQQLICKIKDVEGHQNDKLMEYDLEKSSLQVKVKELEQELKTVKKSYDIKLKKMEKKVPENNNSSIHKAKTKDIGINTTPEVKVEVKARKPEVKEKCVMTDEFYSLKDDVYPVFCSKCEALLEPVPLEKICKIMTDSCPQLIGKITSPVKKPSPLPDLEIVEDEYKTEGPTRLETPSPNLDNREDRKDYISANILPSHTPAKLNRPDYCNGFHQAPNLMHQSAYYVGPTPVNPLLNASTTNQNNSCDDMGAVASSLSIISSLQKRFDTLETKVKKFSKRRSQQNGNCCQHVRQNPCCMYDINSSMQLNFMEMWKRMADLYTDKDKKRSDVNERKKSTKCKLSRLKVKRIRTAYTGGWKVEAAAKKSEQSLFKKRSKKRKYQHAMGNSTEDLDKSVSDSDTVSSYSEFSDTVGDTKVNGNAHTEATNSNSRMQTDALKESAHSPQVTDIDEADVEETIQAINEYCKSVGGETDSGILSDSVESNKLVHLEADADACSMESKSATRTKSPEENTSDTKSSLTNREPTERSTESPGKVIRRADSPKANVDLETPRSDEQTETAEDKHESFPSNDLYPTQTKRKYCKKRKLDEIQESKVCGRGGLLKKLKNLKKASNKIVKTCQSLSEHHEVQNSEHDDAVTEGKKDLGAEATAGPEDDYVPKKKPRVAHVPKPTTIERRTFNKLQQKSNLVRNMASEMNSSTIGDGIESKRDTAEVKATQRNLHSSQPLSNVPETKQANINKKLQSRCTVRVEIMQNVTSMLSSKSTDVTDRNTEANTGSSVDAEQLSEKASSSYRNDCTRSNVNESHEEMMKEDTTKTELRERCEDQNSSLDTSGSSIASNDATSTNESQINEDSNFNESSICTKELSFQLDSQSSPDTNYPENAILKNDSDQRGLNIQEITKNEPSYECMGPPMKSEDLSKDSGVKEETVSNDEESRSPLEKLQQHVVRSKCPNKSCKRAFKKLLYVRLVADKFVKKQLQRLVNSDWEASVHWGVVKKLKTACTPRIIAKGIVEFLCTEEDYNVDLDNSYTPPAPLMTKAQQRIAALLVDLRDPMIFHFVLTGIEYKLFRLNQAIQRSGLLSLARMYAVLARIRKDREKVRIFCCDALYCLGLNAIAVLYIVLTCWPEAFPNNETNKELLPKCMAYLITSQQATDYPKLSALKNLVTVFYKYPIGTLSQDILNELLTGLQEKSHCQIETAIILLSKREGTMWTYKSVIRGAILPMIINRKLPSTYRAFCLLGNLMRSFPVEDKDNSVGEIVEQLCYLINSGEVSYEQQEGVISALLSLSRHKFDEVVQNVIKWKPNGPLCDRIRDQLDGLISLRHTDFWRGYLKKKKLLPILPKGKKA